MRNGEQLGQRIALLGMLVSGLLAVSKLVVGWMAGSTSVVADGVESAGDVLASGVLFVGLWIAARPPDDDHPYGHGRFETLAGLAIGALLFLTGAAIAWRSLLNVGDPHPPPPIWAIWPLVASVVLKAGLAAAKWRVGRRIHSSALIADSWNDSVDILSGVTALLAVGLTISDPARFLAADHYGGCAVGVIVVFLGVQVIRETGLHLMDTMPQPEKMAEIRRVAASVAGAIAVEKCFARKTGLRYHVDMHLEVDPLLSVLEGHDIATEVRIQIKETLPWVADVLIHVEPHGVQWRARRTGPAGR